MVLNATIPITNGSIKYNAKPSSFSEYHYSAVRKFEYEGMQNIGLASRRPRSQAIRVLANPNVCIMKASMQISCSSSRMLSRESPGNSRSTYQGRGKVCVHSILVRPHVVGFHRASPRQQRSKKEVNMVDPVEAKRLAAKQMEEIKAKERLERRRQIEAINGAWAMIGLTAGLVIEGHTGLSIPAQLASYLAAVVGIFTR